MPHKKNASKQSILIRSVRHLLSAVIPRAHNGYHPHLISRYGLAVIALIGVAGMVYAGNQRTAVLGAEPTITPASLLRDVNTVRAEHNAPSLGYNTKLAAAALAKGQNMFRDQYWAHNSPSGITPWKWVQDQQYAYAYAGENLAKNFPSAQATVDAWMASPAHRENMLHDYYRDAGFAVVDGMMKGKPTTIVVALFATPLTQDAAVAAATDTPEIGSNLGLLTRAGLSVRAMNPAVLGAVMLSTMALFVAGFTFFATHMRVFGRATSRKVLAIGSSGTWHQHHTVSKAMGLATFLMVTLLLFGNGQL
ncbi:MAG TPA: CAP domain-containing protein [Patescibacteria group bacterium]|jgi:hypothetical protein|nr:CAP domain-containing protein [Patescibacteria group bacterium]